MRKLFIALTFILIVGRKMETEPIADYSLDLSVMYGNSINSYKIEIDKSMLILYNKKNELGELYKLRLDEMEFKDIQTKISQISEIKCDSISNHYMDGTNYILTLNRDNRKIILISNTCSNFKKVDNFVFDLVKKFDSKKKTLFFEGIILPPPPPPELPH